MASLFGGYLAGRLVGANKYSLKYVCLHLTQVLCL